MSTIDNGENQKAMEALRASGFDGNVTFRRGPRMAPLPKDGKNLSTQVGFEYAEHGYIGDGITLQLPDNKSALASNYPLTLENGLVVTYGQINGLAGDFYGTTMPISDGSTPADQGDRFVAAYNTLAQNPAGRQPAEAQDILAVLQEEVTAIEKALSEGMEPSEAYASLPDHTAKFQQLTVMRPNDQPSYLGLAKINWDHFGADARTAYNAGHTIALNQAIKSTDPANLLKAYAMNAFADHFLEDSFSAGHVRTPRHQLHGSAGTADLCAKYMHDEDNAIGLDVTNPLGNTWHMYGDKRLLDKEDEDNRAYVLHAISVSAEEIYTAWTMQSVILVPDHYGAWQMAPTLASARAATQQLATLFTFENPPQRRTDITKRRVWNFTLSYTYATTAVSISSSGLWKYPIVIGP